MVSVLLSIPFLLAKYLLTFPLLLIHFYLAFAFKSIRLPPLPTAGRRWSHVLADPEVMLNNAFLPLFHRVLVFQAAIAFLLADVSGNPTRFFEPIHSFHIHDIP